MTDRFTAFVIEDANGSTIGRFKSLTFDDLPDHEVLVQVAYTSLNFKDGLSITGKGRIARKLPMIVGSDIAGRVVESRSPDWKPGDQVVVNGWGLSETEWGSYSRYQRVKPEWLTRLPAPFTLEEAAAIGAAGYTAALCVDALERWGIARNTGKKLLVTGAAGGVGSMAVALLAKQGYPVAASTGRLETRGYLERLGAKTVIDRATLMGKRRPLQDELWAGGIDTVGGETLVNALSQTEWGGAIAATGLAGSSDLIGTVFPFILRSVGLIGVDSVMAPASRRVSAWSRLSRDLDKELLASMYAVEPFESVPELAARIMAGRVRGRIVIDLGG